MSTIKQTLAAMEELLSDPSHWTQGSNARSLSGEQLSYSNREAVSFCLIGASRKFAESESHELVVQLLAKAIDPECIYLNCGFTVLYFNDAPSTTHDDIMAVIRAAKEVA